MALEIEHPFGDDPNDLPLEDYCLGIERVLLDILKRALKPDAPPTAPSRPLSIDGRLMANATRLNEFVDEADEDGDASGR